MKKCVYPLVVYADHNENNYLAMFPDLDLIARGDTVEEAYLSALENLEMFLDFAVKMGTDVSAPCTYEETVGLNPKRVVLLASVQVDENAELTTYEQDYKSFISKLLVTEEA